MKLNWENVKNKTTQRVKRRQNQTHTQWERGIDIYGIMDVEGGIAGHGKIQKSSSSSSSTAATSIMKWKWLKQIINLKIIFCFCSHTFDWLCNANIKNRLIAMHEENEIKECINESF